MADDPRQPRDDPGPDGERVARADEPDAITPVPPRAPAWSGRAGVPVRPTGAPGRQPPADWSYGDEPDDRRWWMPIVVGGIALILLTLLLVAGWVIVESTRRNPSGPPSPMVSTPAVTTAATSAPPTTATATATPSATASASTVAPVPLPALVGLPEGVAVDRLERLGLVPQIRFRTSDRPAGTVLETDPSAGAEVVPGDEVTLVIAEPSTPGPTAPTQPTPAG